MGLNPGYLLKSFLLYFNKKVVNYKPNTATVDETVEILVDAVLPMYEAPGLKKTGVPPLPGDDEFVL